MDRHRFEYDQPDFPLRKANIAVGDVLIDKSILAREPRDHRRPSGVRLLLPIVNPVWVRYLSHKVGRLVVPYALIGLMSASLALTERHWFYLGALGLQWAFYFLAGYGAWLEFRQMPRGAAAADVVGREAVLDA